MRCTTVAIGILASAALVSAEPRRLHSEQMDMVGAGLSYSVTITRTSKRTTVEEVTRKGNGDVVRKVAVLDEDDKLVRGDPELRERYLNGELTPDVSIDFDSDWKTPDWSDFLKGTGLEIDVPGVHLNIKVPGL